MPDDLEREVRDLARRVAYLEHLINVGQVGQAVPPANSVAHALPPANSDLLPETTALLPVLGRALLGLAGAYLLRALTESGTFAPKAGVAIGLLYALLWLVWAARTPAARRIETALRALTSVLVLSPLLWEATLRFHAISTWTAGAILLLFIVFGLGVSWRKDLLVVATITTLAGLGTAAGLLMATHDVLPFTLVFLATAAAVEASACLDHWLSERWLAATAADLSVLLATWLVTNARGLPEAYAPIPHSWLLASQVLLLVIYLSSTIIRTLLRGFTFTAFETAQCALAFLIGVGGGLRLSNQSTAVGAIALACAAACYVVSFALLDRDGSHSRNFYTYSTFGILLALAGSRILLSGAAASGAWLALAIGCIWAGGFFGRLTLQVHGGVYLLLALAWSGALEQAGHFLLGEATWSGENPAAIGAGALAAAVCYLLAVRQAQAERGTRSLQTFRVVVAAALIWLVAGIAAGALTTAYHALFGAGASHAYCATMHTGVLAAAALLLAWAGSRWNRLELSRLIYPVMIAGAYRLVVEDLHQDRKAALFLSLLLYGAALMALPRWHHAGGSKPV
ncbi:MAG: hypothetical protein ABSG79_06480 [Bryobacteraceae bacterium]|jgi:hypothetical protein